MEEIFRTSERVVPAVNQYDRLVDFEIDGISFDHKTSVYPKGYSHPLDYAMNHPRDLIDWLYRNQSRQQRMHFRNRIFVVTYSADVPDWKLKAEIGWLEPIITGYLRAFSPEKLHRFRYIAGIDTLSDVIWAIK